MDHSFHHRFKVDSSTGEVRVAVAADLDPSLLDRENRDLMRDLQSLIVEARDGGGASSTVKVTIDLLDVNDNEPIIDSSQYSGTVRENAEELDKPVIVTVRTAITLLSKFRTLLKFPDPPFA